MDPMGTYWAIAWLTWAPLRGFLKKVPPPPNSNGLSSCSSLTASELLFSLYPDPVCSPDARHCGTTQVLSFSVEDSWGAQKQSPNYCKTSHAYMVPNMQKNGCVCVYLIVHIYMYMVFGIRRYNYVYIYYIRQYIYIWVRWQPPQRGIPSCQQGTSPVKPHGYVFCFAKVVFGTPGGKPTSTWNIHLLYIYIIYIYYIYSEVSWNGDFNKIFHNKH